MSNTLFEDEAVAVAERETEECESIADEATELFPGNPMPEIPEGGPSSLADMLRFLAEMRASHQKSDDKDEEEDEENEDDEDSDDLDCCDDDEDDDDEDDNDEDEDEDDEDEGDESAHKSGCKGVKVPVGKRVILRSDYKSNKAYCDAVVKSMQAVLRKNGIHTEPHAIRDDVKVFGFDRTTRGVDVDCHVLCEYEICNYRIEFKFNFETLAGRTPLIDYYCQDKNFPLRYGSVIMDHRDNEKKIEYSSCFYGAFSEEAFARYWMALDSTLKAFAREYEAIASGKKLEPDQRKLVRKIIGELSGNLSTRVKPENEEAFNRTVEMLGGNLPSKMKKLLNYIIEHVK